MISHHSGSRYPSAQPDEQLDRLWDRFLDRIYHRPGIIITADRRVLFDHRALDGLTLAELRAELTRARLRFTLEPQSWLAEHIHLLLAELHCYDVDRQLDRDEDLVLSWTPRDPLTPDPPKPTPAASPWKGCGR